MIKYKAVRGTRDIFGELANKFEFLEKAAKQVFKSFGFEEMRTPIFETGEIFTRSLGENSDIVSKEMYLFKDKGDRLLSLRPEGTAPVVRACVENNLLQSGIDKKFFYIGQMFRYDRPQAGRYRQFHQIGAEFFGAKNPFIDSEIISVAMKIIEKINVKETKLFINSVGCNNCRTKYSEILSEYLHKNSDILCETCVERKNKNILRIFDCKIENCKNLLKNAPKILDFVCDDCKKDFELLQKYLTVQKIEFEVDKSLVRGLDYYTGMVFEIKTTKLGSQDAIAAGGRYDNLVREFSGEDIPAVGFAIGEDRIAELLEERNFCDKKSVFFVTTDANKNAEQILANYDIIQMLREKNFSVFYNGESKSIKSQMRTANHLQAELVIFIEENGSFSIKNMTSGEQKIVTKEEFLKEFFVES